MDLEKFRGAEKTCEKTWFSQKYGFFLILTNHCSGASDLKFEFSTKDLAKEKRYNAFDGRKGYFWPFLSFSKSAPVKPLRPYRAFFDQKGTNKGRKIGHFGWFWTILGRSGVTYGSFWHRFGIIWSSFWCRFDPILKPFWALFGLFLDHFGGHFSPFLGHFYGHFAVF